MPLSVQIITIKHAAMNAFHLETGLFKQRGPSAPLKQYLKLGKKEIMNLPDFRP